MKEGGREGVFEWTCDVRREDDVLLVLDLVLSLLPISF